MKFLDGKNGEGDVFKITIPLKNIATAKVGPNSERSTQDGTHTGTQDGTQNLQEVHQKIITMIRQNNKITRKEMAEKKVWNLVFHFTVESHLNLDGSKGVATSGFYRIVLYLRIYREVVTCYKFKDKSFGQRCI